MIGTVRMSGGNIKKRREFKVTKIGNFFYVTLNSRIKKGDSYLRNDIVSCNDFFQIYLQEGDKIYATNDPSINVAKLPNILVSKLNYAKTKSLTLKVEDYNWTPEIVGGTWDYGSYEYDIRPIVDKNNCIIVDMWKL